MKKTLFSLPLIAGLLAIPALAATNNRSAVKASATTGANEHLFAESIFAEGDYAGKGKINDITDTSWNGRFNALDRYFTGEGVDEPSIWAMNSTTWNQMKSRPYLYFLWAGNSLNKVKVYKKVNSVDADPDAQGADDVLLGSVNNDQFNENNMVMNYILLDTEKFIDGDEVYLRLCDNSRGGGSEEPFGFNTFGYLHVNADQKDISDAIWYHISQLTTDYAADNDHVNFRIHNTINYYLNGKTATDGIIGLSSNIPTSANEDFESNSGFLQRWYRDTTYDQHGWEDNGWKTDGGLGSHDRNYGTIISSANQHCGDKKFPFNKTGNGFFKGFYEDSTGYIATDNVRYRFVSKPFKLSGTGYVSIKMAGRPASLHVLRGMTELAFIDIKTYKTSGDGVDENNVTTGFNSCTLVRHIINLNEFKGQVIQLAIADVDTYGGWGAVNYDELVTYYPTYSDIKFKVDTATQFTNINNYYLDKYVSSVQGDILYVEKAAQDAHGAGTDTSAVKVANDFLSTFYSTVRNKNNNRKFSWCGIDDLSGLKSSYAGLDSNADAKGIVDRSEDFHYGDIKGTLNGNDYYTSSIFKGYTVGQTMGVINGGAYPAPSALGVINASFDSNSTTTIIIIVSLVLITSALFFVVYRRKKTQK